MNNENANRPENPEISPYETRVRRRAEEMAKVYHPVSKYDGYGRLKTELKKKRELDLGIRKMLPAARLAVQWEAEAYASGYYYPGMDGETPSCKEMQIEKGLIPSPNQQKQ